MNERGISGRLRFAGSAPRREHGEDAALGPRQAEPKACDEARRRGFGDDRRGRSRHEMPKRVKSDETASQTMSIMPTAAFICPASGTQPFQMRRFAQDSSARLI